MPHLASRSDLPEPFCITPKTVVSVRDALQARLLNHEVARRHNIVSALRAVNLPIPTFLLEHKNDKPSTSLDQDLCRSLSALVVRRNLSLAETVSLWRNESPSDQRPNKALDPQWLDILLHGYPQKAAVLEAAKLGVSHAFRSARSADKNPVQNHKSANEFPAALLRSVGEGQATGTQLIIDMDTALKWSELRFSPFGCVPKKGLNPAVEARLIHDLSWPDATSTNAQEQFPDLIFVPVRRLAQRIEELSDSDPDERIMMLKGDVKWAFRNIPVAAPLAAHFAGSCTKTEAVIDLALPFGWTGSPAHYGSFGESISFLVSRESPHSLDRRNSDNEPFFSYVWVDDHILLEIDRAGRLALAETALKLSMMAVLGPHAINDKKFSSWSSKLDALGLTWDTKQKSVSMPPDKIAKALARTAQALTTRHLRKHQLEKLLGSLRHVGLCCRASRAFIQRLHQTWRRASKFTSIYLGASVRDDLKWVQAILQHGGMNHVPTSIIAGAIDIDINLFMDASNSGLCVLHPAAREYIRVPFDCGEIAAIGASNLPPQDTFSINVREALSAVFAVIVWGRRWSQIAAERQAPVHVRCWIDNTTAVSWINRHFSSNSYGQELMRVLSCAEMKFNLHVSTAHLPGSSNFLADMGSRAWTGDYLKQWSNTVLCWSEQVVPPDFRKIYITNSLNYNGALSLTPPENSISEHGGNGARTAPAPTSPSGWTQTTPTVNCFNWLCSQLAHGKETTKMVPADLTPFGLNSAMSDGVIKLAPVSDQRCCPNMTSHCKVCDESAPQARNEALLRSRCSKSLPAQPTCPAPSTVSFVGLRCWASSFACAGQNT